MKKRITDIHNSNEGVFFMPNSFIGYEKLAITYFATVHVVVSLPRKRLLNDRFSFSYTTH